ncbi:MAG: DUF2141 domain-containing protein [Deltaproteobacteria bacterium]|nr:DUF2141 domain-containing protein [Deltaproteobacteria bacterium]MDZ4343331.1 DUF2141 domain-containing protein [Candidatus Binatia bacterium]
MPSRSRGVKISLACLIVFSVAVSFSAPAREQSGGPGTIILKVTGLRSEKGQVKIAVFNSSETWLGDHPAYNATIDVDGQSVTWRLNDVPYGDYGIAVFHDENKNGKMDKNFVGIPLEPYGFSNNQRVNFGAPKWEKSKFAVRIPTTEISIEVK